jgi:hypothetical protein
MAKRSARGQITGTEAGAAKKSAALLYVAPASVPVISFLETGALA